MNRIHPGKPPSRRSNPIADWRTPLRSATTELVNLLRNSFELDDPSTRDHVIKAVRHALALDGHASSTVKLKTGDLPPEAMATVFTITSSAFGTAISRIGLDRSDDVAVESFMGEVVRTLDEDMGLGWRSKVRTIVGMNLAWIGAEGSGFDATNPKPVVLDALDQAMSQSPDGEFIKEVDFSDEATNGRWGATMPGTFRIILDAYGLDYRNPDIRQVIIAEVGAALDAQLA